MLTVWYIMTEEQLNDRLQIFKQEIDNLFANCVKNQYNKDKFIEESDKILKKFFDQFSIEEDINFVHKKISLVIHPDKFPRTYPERYKYLTKINAESILFQSAQKFKEIKLNSLRSEINNNEDDQNIFVSESHPTFEFYKNLHDNIQAFFTENIFSFSPYIYKPILTILTIETFCSFIFSIVFLPYEYFICLQLNELIKLQTLAINKLTNDLFDKKLKEEFNEAKFSKLFLDFSCFLCNIKVNFEELEDEILVAYVKLAFETARANNPDLQQYSFEDSYNLYKNYNDSGYNHLKLYIKTIYEYLNNKDKSYLNAAALIALFPIAVLLEAIKLILIAIAFLTVIILFSPVLITSCILLGPLYLINQIHNKFVDKPKDNNSKNCDNNDNSNQNSETSVPHSQPC